MGFWLTLFLAVAPVAAGDAMVHTFEQHSRLSVEVRSTAADLLPGVTLRLCPVPAADADCAVQVTDATGRADFDRPAEGELMLHAELPGFGTTRLGPLSMAADPRAPDQLLVVLNPVCWDC